MEAVLTNSCFCSNICLTFNCNRVPVMKKNNNRIKKKDSPNEFHINVCMLGAPGVGKSSIASQFFYKKLNPSVASSGSVHSYCKTVGQVAETSVLALTIFPFQLEFDNELFVLTIEDVPGNEEHADARHQCVVKSDAFILVYSITSSDSFKQVSICSEACIEAATAPEIRGRDPTNQTDKECSNIHLRIKDGLRRIAR